MVDNNLLLWAVAIRSLCAVGADGNPRTRNVAETLQLRRLRSASTQCRGRPVSLLWKYPIEYSTFYAHMGVVAEYQRIIQKRCDEWCC
ncbi:uncharacterized protein EDB91DRAFT_1107526 [Suillus paluster]|uniref:uncharacterized protein n=1 Tax=Suillus paluster TaxID=48578 RepID=UPI001B85BBF7|nr:uncharacterized protein EDB91DRAFT_1107526 [Suillus paluster]KAG1750449.1 hypothetical protein EDB91DRAFT_1107526 [Suillus paluster]